MLAGALGSAIGTWLWIRQRTGARLARQLTAARDHGTVIFNNTPTPAEGDLL
jgi:hypothetical protein